MSETYNYTYIHNTPSHLSAKVNVKEHRAPTDESIRLLREMEKEVEKNLVRRQKISNNDIDGGVSIFRDFASRGYVVYVSFKLNGKRYEKDVLVDGVASLDLLDTKEVFRKVVAELIYEVVTENVKIEFNGG